jgi:hypothetical protein
MIIYIFWANSEGIHHGYAPRDNQTARSPRLLSPVRSITPRALAQLDKLVRVQA